MLYRRLQVDPLYPQLMDQEQSYEEALENPYQPVDNPGINGLVILLAL